MAYSCRQPEHRDDSGSSMRHAKLARGEYRPPSAPWPAQDWLRIPRLEKSHEGEWSCTVHSRALNLSWTTAWVNLKVMAAPSYLSHLLEDKVTRWLFHWTGSELGALWLLMIIYLISAGLCGLVYFTIKKLYINFGLTQEAMSDPKRSS